MPNLALSCLVWTEVFQHQQNNLNNHFTSILCTFSPTTLHVNLNTMLQPILDEDINPTLNDPSHLFLQSLLKSGLSKQSSSLAPVSPGGFNGDDDNDDFGHPDVHDLSRQPTAEPDSCTATSATLRPVVEFCKGLKK